jgi:ribosomal protein L15E
VDVESSERLSTVVKRVLLGRKRVKMTEEGQFSCKRARKRAGLGRGGRYTSNMRVVGRRCVEAQEDP